MIVLQVLLTVAALTLIFGQDHPAGKWSQRHLTPATAAAIKAGYEVKLDEDEIRRMEEKKQEEEGERQEIREVTGDEEEEEKVPSRGMTTTGLNESKIVELDVMVNEPLTWKTAGKILLDPLTWLPALA
jgi:MFS transporter, NNP family, nitrate/nitrite transporter